MTAVLWIKAYQPWERFVKCCHSVTFAPLVKLSCSRTAVQGWNNEISIKVTSCQETNDQLLMHQDSHLQFHFSNNGIMSFPQQDLEWWILLEKQNGMPGMERKVIWKILIWNDLLQMPESFTPPKQVPIGRLRFMFAIWLKMANVRFKLRISQNRK